MYRKTCDRRPGGIEPLSLSAPTGLKPAPNTSQAQFGIEPLTIWLALTPSTSYAGILKCGAQLNFAMYIHHASRLCSTYMSSTYTYRDSINILNGENNKVLVIAKHLFMQSHFAL